MKNIIVFVVSVMMTFASFGQIPADAGAISGSANVCANSTASYSVGVIANATSYLWVIPNGAAIVSGYGSNSIMVKMGTSSGDVIVFGQNGNILGNPSSLNVTVNAAPTISVNASPTDICAGSVTTLTANGSGIASFAWSGTTATTASVTVNPTATTTYTVTVTGNNSCVASGNVTVNVHAAPNVTLNLVEDNVCTDVNSVLLAGGYPTGGTYSCSSPNVIFGGTTVHPPIIGAGTYVITYTVTDMYGCSASSSDLFTVNPVPAVMFNNIPGPVTTSSTPIDLNNVVMPQGGEFSGPGTTPGSSILNFESAGAGTHMLTYTYTHPITGCSASQIQYVTIVEDSTGNNTIGINETTDNKHISLYPNPTNGIVNISVEGNVIDIQLFDLTGNLMYSYVGETIDLTSVPTGLYLIKVITEGGNVYYSKVTRN